MKKLTVAIKKFEDIGRFVNIMDRMTGTVDLKNGQYVVDARSVVGVVPLIGAAELELFIYEPQRIEVERQLLPFAMTN